jgi:hypothetical protein
MGHGCLDLGSTGMPCESAVDHRIGRTGQKIGSSGDAEARDEACEALLAILTDKLRAHLGVKLVQDRKVRRVRQQFQQIARPLRAELQDKIGGPRRRKCGKGGQPGLIAALQGVGQPGEGRALTLCRTEQIAGCERGTACSCWCRVGHGDPVRASLRGKLALPCDANVKHLRQRCGAARTP